MVLGFLEKKYKPLVNEKSPNKEKLEIKIGTLHEPMMTSKEYHQLFLQNLTSLAEKYWDEQNGHFKLPEFKLIFVPNCGPLGMALLALY